MPASETASGKTGGLAIGREGARTLLVASGEWTIDTIGGLARQIASLDLAGEMVLDLRQVAALDTSGAYLILHLLGEAQRRRAAMTLGGLQERHAGLLRTIERAMVPVAIKGEWRHPWLAVLERLGRNSVEQLQEGRDLVAFLGAVAIALGRALIRPSRLRLPALFSHMERAGFNALLIVGLLAFLIGIVLAYQGADQLARFGAQIFTVNLVAIGMLREMGVLMTAIIVAGRSGSAFTAQIGTMQVNEEIDALRTIGLDPIELLAVPRILALLIVLPLLTFYADMMGLLGGAVMAILVLDISFAQFASQAALAVKASTFFVGMVKAPLFGFVIGLVGCYEGLQVSRSAESVGLRTTRSVVASIFIIIVLDAGFSILFALLRI